jgi:histidinol-phosphate aminotransferase
MEAMPPRAAPTGALSNPSGALAQQIGRPESTQRPRIQPRDDVNAMVGYHSPQVNVRVRLNTNESPFPPPVAWQEALADHVASIDFARYPDRSAMALRKGIAALHRVDAENVFVANGSNEVLQTICLTYAGTGRTVVTFEPTYALHGHIARTSGATVVEGMRDEQFRIQTDDASELITRTQPAVTFLCSPNNPTGVVDDESVVEAVMRVAPGLIVVDEAYGQFSNWSALDLIDEERSLCVVRTFSKTWSMAAARLGYVVGPTWMITELEKVVLPYHLDAMKQAAGTLALTYEADMRHRVAQLVEQRGSVSAGLAELDVDVWPSQANFILFRPRRAAADAVWQGLVERSVLVRNCASWNRLDGCLRVTIGTADENREFLTALRDTLDAMTFVLPKNRQPLGAV